MFPFTFNWAFFFQILHFTLKIKNRYLVYSKWIWQMRVETSCRNTKVFSSLIYLFSQSVSLWQTWPLFLALPLRFLYPLPFRHLLHHCFQALMDHGVKVASILANSFSRRCSYIAESDAHVKEKAIQFGFVLGQQLCFVVFFLFFLFFYFLNIVNGWLKVVVKSVLLSGGFLSDAGWYGDAEKVFLSCLQLCMLHDEILHWYRALECCVRWG